MSPSSDNVPQTPNRRASSSNILGAFKNFTTSRLRSPTPPTSASSSTTPARTPSLRTHRTASIASGSGDVAAPAAHSLLSRKGSGALGGPPELEDIFIQLHSSQPHQVRAQAIDKLCLLLQEHPVRNVLGLWATASDLLLPEQSNEAAATGYKLLKSCVSLDYLTPAERSVFFDAACLRKTDNSFHLRLDIISTLTNGGKNVEACEASLVLFILSSLDVRFKESCDALEAFRKANPKKKMDQPPRESENLGSLFHFITELSRFNSKIFSDDDLEQLLTKTMTICQETKQQSDIRHAIKLFDAIITYVHVPTQVLKPSLEVLCIIHRQLEDLQEQSWNTLSNLFKSYVGQTAVSSLLHTLLDGPHRKSRQYPVYRGVIQVLQRLLLEDGLNGLPTVPVSLLVPALKSSIEQEHVSQEECVLDLIRTLLSDGKLRELLRSEADWNDLIHIIDKCIGRNEARKARSVASTATKGPTSKATTTTGKTASTAGTSSVPDGSLPLLMTYCPAKPCPAIGAAVSATSMTGESEGDPIANADSSATAPPTYTEPTRRNAQDSISRLLLKLNEISNDVDVVQRAAIMELFMRYAMLLSDVTAENMIRFYAAERYFHPSNEEWLEACRALVAGVFKDETRPRWLRILCIENLRETYNTVVSLCASDIVLQVATLLLHNIETEEDVEVLCSIVDFAVEIADQAPLSCFLEVVTLLKSRLDRLQSSLLSPATKSPSLTLPTLQANKDQRLGSTSNVIATAFVRLFIRSITKSAQKVRTLYENLREIVRSEELDNDARLTSLKLLFRLRADSNHAVVVGASSEGECIAAVLRRTEETAVIPMENNGLGLSVDQGKQEDQVSWREQRKVSGSSPRSSLNRQIGRQASVTGRVSKPIPPMWIYPGPKGLPEEPSSRYSRVVFSHIDAEEYPLNDDLLDLEVTLWLELVISLLQRPSDWEIYSYVLVHLGPQLSNQSLVRSCMPQLKMLRSVICEQIRNSTFHEPPAYTLLKKEDVAVCLFHILTVLISYHDYYEKSEEDDLVKVFLIGIGNDRTPKWCIHALTVCCHETPLSVGKSLKDIVEKMSTIVTKQSAAIHILEFLTSLARMPELYRNFREDDYKKVFGVSFRYLQHIRDHRERIIVSNPSHHGHRTLRHTGASRDLSAPLDINASTVVKSAADDLPPYLYSLAYHVIAFWFMGLKMEDRPKFIPWITKNLSYTDNTGRLIMEEQGQAIVDVMSMVAYTDRDQTIRPESFAQPSDGEIWKKTWIAGHSVITIETAARTGVSLITTRRPVSIP